MIGLGLLEKLFTYWKRAASSSSPTNTSSKGQENSEELQHQALKDKDILTLEEAAFYLGTDPGTLLEEVSLGKLPGGRFGAQCFGGRIPPENLLGQWHFYKSALSKHFSIYHGSGPYDWETAIADEFQGHSQCCDPKTVERLLKEYAEGDRNFSGIDLSYALMSGVSLPNIYLAEGMLEKIDLRESNLQSADFEDANLRGASLSGSDWLYRSNYAELVPRCQQIKQRS